MKNQNRAREMLSISSEAAVEISRLRPAKVLATLF
jgi:hypothetical protein